jgi:hypothetical protein
MRCAKWLEPFTAPFTGSKIATTISRRRLEVTRILAVASFSSYVYSQTHILYLPSPEASQIYSPNEYFLIAYFVASVLLNICWLRQLFFRWDYAGDTMPLAFGWHDEEDTSELIILEKSPSHLSLSRIHGLSSAQVTCLPFHIAGSMFLSELMVVLLPSNHLLIFFTAAWSLAWFSGYFLLSQFLLAGNLSVQLYTVFLLLHVDQDEFITPINYLTHLVMKTNTGLAVLFAWKNWGVIDVDIFSFLVRNRS